MVSYLVPAKGIVMVVQALTSFVVGIPRWQSGDESSVKLIMNGLL